LFFKKFPGLLELLALAFLFVILALPSLLGLLTLSGVFELLFSIDFKLLWSSLFVKALIVLLV